MQTIAKTTAIYKHSCMSVREHFTQTDFKSAGKYPALLTIICFSAADIQSSHMNKGQSEQQKLLQAIWNQ